MNGLVNKAIQSFVIDTYGFSTWKAMCDTGHLEVQDFEAMLDYSEDLSRRMITTAANVLEKAIDAFLEDVGTWIISGTEDGVIRRLLRFGGADFDSFLQSLDELPDRARMAIPDLQVPDLSVTRRTERAVDLELSWPRLDLSPILCGALRALADDYGALALIEHRRSGPRQGVIAVELLDNTFARARTFNLAGPS